MNVRDLTLFLGLQLFAVIWAGICFSFIESRLLAGALAGGYFVLSGLFMAWRSWRWQNKWRSATIYPLFVHVFAISLPMVVARFMQAGTGFEAVTILGLGGPTFHRISSWVFGVLVLATLIDLIRLRRAAKTARA